MCRLSTSRTECSSVPSSNPSRRGNSCNRLRILGNKAYVDGEITILLVGSQGYLDLIFTFSDNLLFVNGDIFAKRFGEKRRL